MARRILSLLVLAAGIVAVSCAAPAAPVAPPLAPTQAAPQPVGPTQTIAAPVQPTTGPSTAQPATPTATSAPAATATKAAATTPPNTAVPTAAPTQSRAATASPTKAAAAQPTAGAPAKLDMNAIFPPGPGRDVVLDNCTTCHTFVPLVILQYNQQQWDLSARNHRDRVPRLSDADFKSAYAYLAAHFNPDHPVPQLPQNLLDTWTDY